MWVKRIAIKKLSLKLFQSWTTWFTGTQSLIQSVLKFPQNGRSTCTENHSHNRHQKFVSPLQQVFTSLFHLLECSQKHAYNARQYSLAV